MSIHALRNSFNAGEISPLMETRVDAEKHGFACRKLENFIPRIYGSAFKRPGMIYLGEAGDETETVHGFSFNVSATESFFLEFGDEYFRIWRNREPLRWTTYYGSLHGSSDDADGSVIENVSPYAAADLADLKIVQLNNVAYFVHPEYPVHRLTRTIEFSGAPEEWDLAEIEWSWRVFQDANVSDITVEVDATTGTGQLDFSAAVLNKSRLLIKSNGYVGTHVAITHRRASNFVAVPLTSTADSAAIKVIGAFDLITYGTWTGTVAIEQKQPDGEWKELRAFSAAADRNIAFNGVVEELSELRIGYTHTSNTGSPRAVLEVGDSRQTGVVRIDSIEDVDNEFGLRAQVTIIEPLASTDPTTDWALEAFGDWCGYPRAVTFHEQRLWFAGTQLQPTTFWGSKTNDFQNFRRGAFDADALAFTLAATEGSAIQSMLSHEALLLFTETEEWTASTSENTAITPSNIFVRRQSRIGSAYRQSFIALNNIVFLAKGKRKVREFSYNLQGGRGESMDLTLLSEHITAGNIQGMAYQQQPDPIIWCWTETGELLSLTYEADQNVIGWARHPTDGNVESVAVIYGSDADSDEVYLTTLRTINGTERRFIELLDPAALDNLENDALSDFIYLDAAKTQSFSPAASLVKGLDHLEGESVTVYQDGFRSADKTVSGGSITLDVAAETVTVGLPYTSKLQPSSIELPMDDGTAQGRKMLCKRIALKLYKTLGLSYSDSLTSDIFPVQSLSLPTAAGSPQPLFTGTVQLANMGAYRDNVDIVLIHNEPTPCNIQAMIPKFEILGD